ncbi:hypothetical protein HHL11_13025 [Ramlibacter sp. G-1-2-2]|uniref:Uncharacterized protein n=1 Tax=Ramlibacter agri TaxID=2728837 RepID=A0A848H5X3_9BURK|nr:hypothetical protein [Ramlibacter agri]NML44680.1 hypothetical protein [Ramlibacter agri]
MIAALLRSVVLALLATGMAGCVATKYDTIPYDTPRPAELAELSGCSDAARNRNEPCVALVRASDWQTLTDIEVDANQAWRIELPKNQRWFDASRISSPLDGEPGSDQMNTAADWKRMPGAPWFALAVGVAAKAGDEVQGQAVRNLPGSRDVGFIFRPTRAGTLVFFPNDAIPPTGSHYFYGNNGGQIWVKLTRLQ